MGEAGGAPDLTEIVDLLTDGIALLDREGRCRYLNPEAARIIGRPPADFVGKVMWEVTRAPVAPALAESFGRILGGEEVMLARSLYARERWYECLARPLGERVVVLLRDITERLQAESARHQSEQRFRLLVDGVHDHAIVMLDPKAQVASWNSGAERLFGYRAEEILGHNTSTFFTPEDEHRGLRLTVASLAAARGSFQGEGWLVRRDGSRFFAQFSVRTLSDELGYPTGFVIVAHDKTASRELEQRLRTSEERRRMAVEAAEVGTWEYVARTDRLIADERSLALCGFPPGAEPTYPDFLGRIHPDDRERMRHNTEQALAATSGYAFGGEYRTLLTDGVVRWIEVRGRVVRDEAGEQRILGAIRDMTRHHHQDEFRKLAAGLVAHDLRSPLSAIKLSGQVLLRHGVVPSAAVRTVEAILRNTDQMAHMAQQLLDYVQAQFGGGLPLEREPVDLEEVSRHIVVDAEATHPDRELRFASEGDCGGLWDRTRITEVVANLVSNALEHGQPGEPIDVVVRPDGDAVVFRIHNTGPPVPPDVLPAIFDPFSRAVDGRPARAPGGASMGLGLYITREIVSAHGGDIEVRSSSAEGTTFTVRLPRGHREADHAASAHVA